MADEEHFSLCWNNFNANLSTGFHESLCRGDLVDVTLIAEGQMVKAHRLVLSVCSPLFRDMFAAMTPNQQAFVVLPNITHTALQDLITFIYCGEVNVKNEALTTFISTAESLQIKGLTDTDSPPTKPEAGGGASTATTIPHIITVPAPPAPIPTAAATTTTRPRVQAQGTRSSTSAAPALHTSQATAPAQKRISRQQQQHQHLESEESGTEEVRVAQKRLSGQQAQKTTASATKRIKIAAASTPVPKREAKQEQSVLIEVPIEAAAEDPEDAEDDDGEAAVEMGVQEVEEEATQAEDDESSYIKFEDSYYTVNETATTGAAADSKTFNTTNASSTGNTTGASYTVEDSQGKSLWTAAKDKKKKMKKENKKEKRWSDQRKTPCTYISKEELRDMKATPIKFRPGQRGSRLLEVGGYTYVKNRVCDTKTYWICARKGGGKCQVRAVTTLTNGVEELISFPGIHSHGPPDTTN